MKNYKIMDIFKNPYLLTKPFDLEEPSEIVTRKEWEAEKPLRSKTIDEDNFPLQYMVIMYTKTPACRSKSECNKVVQVLQKKHLAEGAPDIKHNYLISVDGTIYEGSSPKLVTMTYGKDDNTLRKANENSVNIAIIDDGKENETSEKLSDAATKLTAKLIRDEIIVPDVRVLWFDQDKKNKQLPPKGMETFRSQKNTTDVTDNTTPVTSILRKKDKKNNKRNKKSKPDEFNDKIVRGKAQGPFILEPNHIGTLITESDQFAEREDYDPYF